VYTEIAIEQLPGIISFFQTDIPLAFKAVKDPKLLADFRKANDAVIQALGDYEKYLKADVLPRSHGDFRLGAEVYAPSNRLATDNAAMIARAGLFHFERGERSPLDLNAFASLPLPGLAATP